MKPVFKHLLLLISIPAVLALISPAFGEDPNQNLEATANRLVTQCAAVREGDLVLIQGEPRDMELLEHVALEVRKLGAFPLLNIETERLARRMYTDVPSKFDTQTPMMHMKLAETVNAVIRVRGEENPSLLAEVATARIAAQRKTMQQIMQVMHNRNVRQVELGNGLYPTEATARQFGLPLDELTSIFWKGVNVDYMRLQAVADTVRNRMTRGDAVRITDANGTDFQCRIQKRPVMINDGVISADDVRAGKAACQVWLPAGEVYCTVVPNTAEGTIVIDRHYFQGQEIRDLRLTFKNGRLTNMTAKSGLESLKKLYDESGQGKDQFAAIDIGVNPDIRIPENSRLAAWMASGMITVGIGNDTWAGGENNCDFDLYAHIRRGTLAIDGKNLVEKGELTP